MQAPVGNGDITRTLTVIKAYVTEQVLTIQQEPTLSHNNYAESCCLKENRNLQFDIELIT